MNKFEPKIVLFLCNWCSYAGADLAGTSRLQYAPNVRVVRLMCSGRVEPYFIIEALKAGADGVLVLGCHPGECHYLEGNYRTAARMALLKKMLHQFGMEDGRVRLDWVSASEGVRFASLVNHMTETVRALGPLEIFQTSEPCGSIPAEGGRFEASAAGRTAGVING
jgi:F420-non-reducing hydrogenase iron-sulfur subunit